MKTRGKNISYNIIYAVYGEDDYPIAIGTAEEVAEKLGMTPSGVISCVHAGIAGYYRIGKELKTDMERMLSCIRRLKTSIRRRNENTEWQIGYYAALEDVRKAAEDLRRQDEEYAVAVQAELDRLFSKE